MTNSLSYRCLAIFCLGMAVAVLTGCNPQEPTFTPYPPTTGAIAVLSNPSGADIYLDGQASGLVTPDTLHNVEQGPHVIRVVMAAHSAAPDSQEVTVVVSQTVTANFTLTENPGGILVRSFPGGATIFLDGNDTGKTTPDTLQNLASGQYVVRVELTGYTAEPESSLVTVQPEQIVPVDFNLSAPQTGDLQVTSTPSGATIILDGTDTGRLTPDTFTGLDTGDHVVKVYLAGYAADPESLVVNIVADQTALADFALIPQTGEVTVSANVPGAAIFLDDVDTGEVTPATLTGLSVGDHTIRVSLPGFEVTPAAQVVNIQAGQTASASFTLSVVKTVLLEAFSNVSCIGCPEMAATIHELMTTPGYEVDKLLLIKYSMNWPQLTDPHYQANPADNLARATFYQDYLSIGIPTLAGDGVLLGDSGNPPELAELTTLVDGMLASTPEFALEVEATIAGTIVNCTVTVRAVNTVDLSDYTLNAVLVENPVEYETPPGNQGETVFHWVMRDFHDMMGSVGIITPDFPATFQHTLIRDASWPVEHLYVVAFVQHNSDRSILQAGSNALGSHQSLRAPLQNSDSSPLQLPDDTRQSLLPPTTLPPGGSQP